MASDSSATPVKEIASHESAISVEHIPDDSLSSHEHFTSHALPDLAPSAGNLLPPSVDNTLQLFPAGFSLKPPLSPVQEAFSSGPRPDTPISVYSSKSSLGDVDFSQSLVLQDLHAIEQKVSRLVDRLIDWLIGWLVEKNLIFLLFSNSIEFVVVVLFSGGIESNLRGDWARLRGQRHYLQPGHGAAQ